MKALALPSCDFELGMEYKLHEAYELLVSLNPFPSFCSVCEQKMHIPNLIIYTFSSLDAKHMRNIQLLLFDSSLP